MKFFSLSLFTAWMVSLTATLGSLFFSEIMGFIPCSLCWYQRIFMYPVCILLTIGIFQNDKKVKQYVLPLIILGGLFAIYHNLLMWGIIPESVSPCRSGIPCSTRYIEYFGFITIPLLSMTAFIFMFFLLFKKENYE